MKIGLYNQTIMYKQGGTESYTAFVLQTLQMLYPKSTFTLIGERNRLHKGSYTAEAVVLRLNDTFGTHIDSKSVYVKEISNRFGLISLIPAFYKESSKYDLFFNCSVNMLIPNGKKNIFIVHFPDRLWQSTRTARMTPLNMLIAKKVDDHIKNAYSLYLCNSQFTAGWLKKRWNVDTGNIFVIYPPVKMIEGDVKKNNSILVCSRIDASKKIEDLIEAFKNLGTIDYKLVIAGACTSNSEKKYYENLKERSVGYPVEFKINLQRNELEKTFLESKLFWHAKGFDVNENDNPYLLEHFGITTVEAMSAGCIPVVINKGGQKEIVDEGVNGYKWNSIDELILKTKIVLENENIQKTFFVNAREKALNYSVDVFSECFKKILTE